MMEFIIHIFIIEQAIINNAKAQNSKIINSKHIDYFFLYKIYTKKKQICYNYYNSSIVEWSACI